MTGSPRPWWFAAWIVPLAVFAVEASACTSGGGGTGGLPPTPSFAFTLTKSVPVSIKTAKVQQLAGPAAQAASAVSKTMTDLYTEAFLDPSNWHAGSYDSVWSLFDGGATAAAQKSAETLTAGAGAGGSYETIEPSTGTLAVKVLLDRNDQPGTAVAIVRFAADATAKDGTVRALVSSGQFYLHPTPGGWIIYSFEVDRRDHPVAPPPSPTGIPSGAPS